uniref:NADAR domain-containing protein n=1 Tax=Strongyloides venezuelensis TaxID=75913 RepID=A0A0K0F296_STRVS
MYIIRRALNINLFNSDEFVFPEEKNDFPFLSFKKTYVHDNISQSLSAASISSSSCNSTPRKSYTIINGDYIIFKGEVSQLSNFFEKKFYDEEGTQFLTMEHYFHFKKAIFFNDAITAQRTFKAPTAIAAKCLAKNPELRQYLKKCYLCGNKSKYFIDNSEHQFWGAKIRNVTNNVIYNQINDENKLGALRNRLARQLFYPH